jgi:hypothetical protein
MTDEFERDQREIKRYRETGQINCPRGNGKFDMNDSTCSRCTYLLVCAMKKRGF